MADGFDRRRGNGRQVRSTLRKLDESQFMVAASAFPDGLGTIAVAEVVGDVVEVLRLICNECAACPQFVVGRKDGIGKGMGPYGRVPRTYRRTSVVWRALQLLGGLIPVRGC